MLRSLLLLVCSVLPLTAQSRPAESHTVPDCLKPSPEVVDSIRTIVHRLHPEILTPEHAQTGSVVGLIFNERCELTHHTLGRRDGDGEGVLNVLAAIFPRDFDTGRMISAGIGEASDTNPQLPKSPWIVWAVLKPDSNAQR